MRISRAFLLLNMIIGLTYVHEVRPSYIKRLAGLIVLSIIMGKLTPKEYRKGMASVLKLAILIDGFQEEYPGILEDAAHE